VLWRFSRLLPLPLLLLPLLLPVLLLLPLLLLLLPLHVLHQQLPVGVVLTRHPAHQHLLRRRLALRQPLLQRPQRLEPPPAHKQVLEAALLAPLKAGPWLAAVPLSGGRGRPAARGGVKS
jgi:hypothetical protein